MLYVYGIKILSKILRRMIFFLFDNSGKSCYSPNHFLVIIMLPHIFCYMSYGFQFSPNHQSFSVIRLVNHTQIRMCAIFSCYLRHNDGLRWDMSLVIYYSKLWNHNIGTWDRNYTKGIMQCSIAASLYSVLSMWLFMDYVWNDAVHWWVWFIVICTYITKCKELKYVQFSTCNVLAHYFSVLVPHF